MDSRQYNNKWRRRIDKEKMVKEKGTPDPVAQYAKDIYHNVQHRQALQRLENMRRNVEYTNLSVDHQLLAFEELRRQLNIL
jgi:hypothetical protein